MFSTAGTNPLEDLLRRARPSPWAIFWRSPVVCLARLLYTRRQIIYPTHTFQDTVSIVCISDTHNSQPQLPYADVLIHAGDLTQSGSFPELQKALDWIKEQLHPHKIVVAGNHDLLLDETCDDRLGGLQASTERLKLSWGDVIYLQDSRVLLRRLYAAMAGNCEYTAAQCHVDTEIGRFSIHVHRATASGRDECRKTLIYSLPTAHRGLIWIIQILAALDY